MKTFCGFSLSSVGVVIGWLGVILSFIWCILQVMNLCQVDSIPIHNNQKLTEEAVRVGLKWLFAIKLVLSIILLFTSALLIIGTVKERHLLLMPWLSYVGFGIVCKVVYVIYFLITAMNFAIILVILIVMGLLTALEYAIWAAIYSLFKQIRAKREDHHELVNADN